MYNLFRKKVAKINLFSQSVVKDAMWLDRYSCVAIDSTWKFSLLIIMPNFFLLRNWVTTLSGNWTVDVIRFLYCLDPLLDKLINTLMSDKWKIYFLKVRKDNYLWVKGRLRNHWFFFPYPTSYCLQLLTTFLTYWTQKNTMFDLVLPRFEKDWEVDKKISQDVSD